MPMPDVACPRCGRNRLIRRIETASPGTRGRVRPSSLRRHRAGVRSRAVPGCPRDPQPDKTPARYEVHHYVCELCGHTWRTDVIVTPRDALLKGKR